MNEKSQTIHSFSSWESGCLKTNAREWTFLGYLGVEFEINLTIGTCQVRSSFVLLAFVTSVAGVYRRSSVNQIHFHGDDQGESSLTNGQSLRFHFRAMDSDR